MNILHGPETAKRFRDMGYKGPIIAVTGNVMNEDVADFLSKGANKVIGKPLNLSEFKSLFN